MVYFPQINVRYLVFPRYRWVKCRTTEIGTVGWIGIGSTIGDYTCSYIGTRRRGIVVSSIAGGGARTSGRALTKHTYVLSGVNCDVA